MNWGYKILAFYVVFVLGILLLVFKSSSQKVELVSKDYYEQELVYQQRINANSNTASLSAPVTVTHAGELVTITLPAEMKNKKVDGNVLMYCPSESAKDFPVHVTADNGILKFAMPKETKGSFDVKVNWDAECVHYYAQDKILF